LRTWWSNFRVVLNRIFPGSILAAAGMLIVTWMYSFYIRYVSRPGSNFNILYGGLSTIVLLLLWFYALSFVLIIGIQFNAAWAENKEKENAKDDR
jgi:membrane protein